MRYDSLIYQKITNINKLFYLIRQIFQKKYKNIIKYTYTHTYSYTYI